MLERSFKVFFVKVRIALLAVSEHEKTEENQLNLNKSNLLHDVSQSILKKITAVWLQKRLTGALICSEFTYKTSFAKCPVISTVISSL